jgi:hypothetical protein
MLKIISQPIGVGRERACYVHPEDPRLAIKIPTGPVTDQTERDVRFYRRLKKRGLVGNVHIPKYFGMCETSIGPGIVVEMIRNYDGEIARPLNWYLAQGVPVEEFDAYLEQLKESFLQDLIIFNHDMQTGNLLFQKTSMGSARLVAIDGLGDTVALDWLDNISFLVRRKINRRWKRFIKRIYLSQEVRAQRAAEQATESRQS